MRTIIIIALLSILPAISMAQIANLGSEPVIINTSR